LWAPHGIPHQKNLRPITPHPPRAPPSRDLVPFLPPSHTAAPAESPRSRAAAQRPSTRGAPHPPPHINPPHPQPPSSIWLAHARPTHDRCSSIRPSHGRRSSIRPTHGGRSSISCCPIPLPMEETSGEACRRGRTESRMRRIRDRRRRNEAFTRQTRAVAQR
jgi:hypothetical protein